MQARPGDTCGKQGSRVAFAEVRGTLRPDPGDERSGGRMHRGCSPTPALGPLACRAAKTQEGTVLFRPTICHFDDKASWPWVEDGTPGQTEEGGASLATGLFPASLHPSRPGLLPPSMGCGAWRLDERRSPPAVAHLRSPHRSAAEPPRPPPPRAGTRTPAPWLGTRRRAGRTGRGGSRGGSGAGQCCPRRTRRTAVPRAPHSMGRRCWRRRALAAACLGAALLLLGAAPRALRPGECPSGPSTGTPAVFSRAEG